MVNEGGVYANGQVVVKPLPTALYGDDAQRTIPLRRWEAVLTDGELEEQCAKELQKVYDAPCMYSQGAPHLSRTCCIAHCACTYTVTASRYVQKITLNLFVHLVGLQPGLTWNKGRPA